MAMEVKEITIGGDLYRIGQVPAESGWRIACRVLEHRGKVLASLGVDAATLSLDPGAQTAALGRTQATMATTLRDPEYWREVVQPLLAVCMRGGSPVLAPDWQLHYAGAGLANLIQVYIAAVDHNCAGFFHAFGDTHELIAALERLAKARTLDPAADTTTTPQT